MGLDDDVAGAQSYRWDNIRQLHNSGIGEALRNADSLAYTCIAAKLIAMGYRVAEDGTLSQA